MRSPARSLLALIAALGWLVPAVATAETVDQLLREVGAYLDRDSCESARAVLEDIPAADRDARAHILMARTGRCLNDLQMTIDALRAFDAVRGQDPAAAELRAWVESATDAWSTEFDAALASSDCGTAGRVLRRLEGASGSVALLDRGLIARCHGDVKTVEEILTNIDRGQLKDRRARSLRAFVDDSKSAAVDEFETHLADGQCQSAGSALRHLEDTTNQASPIGRARVARCRDDVGTVRQILEGLSGADLGDPQVGHLRAFVRESQGRLRDQYQAYLDGGECATAESVLSQLANSLGVLEDLDRALLARCRGDRKGVEAVLAALGADENGDPRAAVLNSFLNESYSAIRGQFESSLSTGDCASATTSLHELRTDPRRDGSAGEQSLVDLARLSRCNGDATGLAELLDTPALRGSADPQVQELRGWLETGPVPVSYQMVLAGSGDIAHGVAPRGGVAAGTVMLPLPVPPHEAPVSFSILIPHDYDPLGSGPFSIHLDPSLHPAVGAYQELLSARRRARPYRIGTAILASVSAGFLAWGGIEVGLAFSAAQEANGIDNPDEKARFLELQTRVTGAYPRIGVALGVGGAGLAFTIVIPALGRDRSAEVRRAQEHWWSLATEPYDSEGLTP